MKDNIKNITKKFEYWDKSISDKFLNKNFSIVLKGNVNKKDLLWDVEDKEVQYEVLKDNGTNYYVRIWVNGTSKCKRIPREIYEGIDWYLESEVICLLNELDEKIE